MTFARYSLYILTNLAKLRRSMNISEMMNSGYACIVFSITSTVKQMSKLSPEMQARLDKWRMNPVPVKKLIEKKQSPGNFVSRRRDHDLEDEEYEKMRKDGK